MSKLIVTRGVPASGKTTWAKAWVAESDERRARVNRDEYRAMMFDGEGVLTFPQEKAVSYAQQAAVKGLLNAGMDVVVDDTNLRAKYSKMWVGFSDDVEYRDFPITIDEAYERDSAREARGDRSVGASVLKNIFARFIEKDGISLPPVPTRDLRGPKFKPYVADEDLTPAFGFDLDGTLAKMNGRGPYDNTQYHTDIPHAGVVATAQALHYAGYAIIVFTGRSEESRLECVMWLQAYEIPFDMLVMRKTGDTRRDDIVKSELFDQYIEPAYNFIAQFDDRDRVVDALREKGIKVYQVERGDF